MDSKLQVFVSSTFKDLKKHRQAAVEAILKCGHIPAGMELFVSGDKSQWDVIKKWINESDVFLLILGGRYGSKDKSTGLSYTQMEYDYAVGQGKPHFAVVIEEKALKAWAQTHSDDLLADDPAKLLTFREKVLQEQTTFFTDHRDVKLR
ncbi:MAG: DUF4062 domain-containing protein, partial [Phycisphaerae bacterium]